MFLRQISQWNSQMDKRGKKSFRVSLKPTAMKHLCLPAAESTHSYKMSSRASSNGERLTLIHKQLPLSLCCRFRTAVPPNPFPAWQKEKKKKKKKKTARLPSRLRNKGKHRSRGEKRKALANQKWRQKDKAETEQWTREKRHAVFSLLCEWNSRLEYQCFCEWKQGLSASARQSLGMAWSYPMRSQLDDSFRGG